MLFHIQLKDKLKRLKMSGQNRIQCFTLKWKTNLFLTTEKVVCKPQVLKSHQQKLNTAQIVRLKLRQAKKCFDGIQISRNETGRTLNGFYCNKKMDGSSFTSDYGDKSRERMREKRKKRALRAKKWRRKRGTRQHKRRQIHWFYVDNNRINAQNITFHVRRNAIGYKTFVCKAETRETRKWLLLLATIFIAFTVWYCI